MNKQQNGSIKTFLIIVVGIVILVVSFLIFDKFTSRDMKAVVINRLSEGVVETKKKKTPEEKILTAVNNNRSRVVKIYATSQNKNTSSDNRDLVKGELLAKGIIYSKRGLIISVKNSFQKEKSYLIEIPGKKEPIIVKPSKIGEQFVSFDANIDMPLVVQVDKEKLSKGDLVVAVGGKDEDSIAKGEVFLVDKSTENDFIITTIPAKSITTGAPLMNIKKKVIGLYLKGSVDGKAVFISVNNLNKFLN